MMRATNTAVRLFAEVFDPPGPVVEIGALHLPGFEAVCDVRPYFPGREFIGCDIRPGLGVDRLEDAERLNFAGGSIGTVLLFEILEHLPDPARAISEAGRVLSEDGLLALSVPFSYRLHGYPSDYWRFTASGIAVLLTDFPDKVIFALGPRVKPSFIFAVAAKRGSGEFAERKGRFRARVEESFRRSRGEGFVSAFKERGRDFFGLLLGRADLSATFFEPGQPGGYRRGGE